MSLVLDVSNVTKRFSQLTALDHVSIQLNEGEILGLIGPNGSGKTTLINVVSGIIRPDSGKIKLNDMDITGIMPHRICHFGLNRTFQTPRPFPSLTVEENVLLALVYGNRRALKKDDLSRKDNVERVLKLTGLFELRAKPAHSLNTFEKKMLDLSRALVTEPRVLLVDELAAGLNPDELKWVKYLLESIQGSGVSMVVVEHIMSFIKDVAGRVIVMDAGKKIYEGDFAGAAKDETVREVYLGTKSVA